MSLRSRVRRKAKRWKGNWTAPVLEARLRMRQVLQQMSESRLCMASFAQSVIQYPVESPNLLDRPVCELSPGRRRLWLRHQTQGFARAE